MSVLKRTGDTRIAPNGYHYTYVDTGSGPKAVLTHRVRMEQMLGRSLREDEYVKFKDNDRTNLDYDNLELRVRRESTITAKLAQLRARREQLTQQIEELESQLTK